MLRVNRERDETSHVTSQPWPRNDPENSESLRGPYIERQNCSEWIGTRSAVRMVWWKSLGHRQESQDDDDDGMDGGHLNGNN